MSRRRRRSKTKRSATEREFDESTAPEEASENPELPLDDGTEVSGELTEPEPEAIEGRAEVDIDPLDLDDDDFDFEASIEPEPDPIAPAPIIHESPEEPETNALPDEQEPTSEVGDTEDSAQALPPRIALQKEDPPLKNADALGELDSDEESPSTEESPAAQPVTQQDSSDAPTEMATSDDQADDPMTPGTAQAADTPDASPEQAPAEDVPTPAPPEDNSTAGTGFRSFVTRLSLFEKVSLLIVGATVLTLGLWGYSATLGSLPKSSDERELDFPIEGQHAVLKDLKTFWRSPRREGEQIDEISQEVELLPYVEIELASSAKRGTLRFLFRDENDQSAGDPTTLTFENGKFLPSSRPTASVNGSKASIRATTGFEREGEILSYVSDPTFRWELVILESSGDEDDDFPVLLECPISPNRKDLP
ncbi:MAG: hypothetical protein Q7Q71_14855 [Verrucomicrobiota bacterium JB023]|nr:hypothetical protein [Verrucomicrobiota bacterium JB023]